MELSERGNDIHSINHASQCEVYDEHVQDVVSTTKVISPVLKTVVRRRLPPNAPSLEQRAVRGEVSSRLVPFSFSCVAVEMQYEW